MGDTPVLLEEILDLRALSGCRIGPLFVQAWRDQPLAREQEQLTSAYEDMIACYPEGFASMALIRVTRHIGSPDAEVRSRAIAQYKRLLPYLKVSTIVIDSQSISAKTVRVFMTAMLMVVRPNTPTRVCSSFDEAFDWMESIPGALAPALRAQTPALRRDILAWWQRSSTRA